MGLLQPGHPCFGCVRVIAIRAEDAGLGDTKDYVPFAYHMLGCSKQENGGCYPYYDKCPGKEEK